jgi:hypothetical protein
LYSSASSRTWSVKGTDLLDRGDHAVGRVAVRETRGEQQPVVGPGLGGLDHRAGVAVELHRHDHARQHDQVRDGQQRKGDDVGHDFLDS